MNIPRVGFAFLFAWLSALLVVPGPAAAQVPVLLVPGWFDTERDMAALKIRLLGAGWPSDRVASVTFEDPAGSSIDHAIEILHALEDLRTRTGADEVDIIAHSMGGLATRWYIMTHPEHGLRRTVFLGSPHRGTLVAHLAWGGGRSEMMPGSPFLDSLNAAQPAPAGVEAITIRTPVDTRIVPGESATLPGVPNYQLCCPTHAGLLRDDEVFDLVLTFLEGME